MKILAIDTSTTHSSCTVMEDNFVIGDFSISQSMSHNEILLVMVDEVLKKLNMDIEEMDLFVTVTGPGSFTGIRIGVTTVKALAMSLNKPIVAVNTLEALSFGIFSDKKKIPLIDARGERVYYGVYEGVCNKNIVAPALLTIDELLEEFSNRNDKFILIGDCTNLYKDRILKIKNFEIAPACLNSCISRNACVIGKQKFENGDISDCFTLSPEYVKLSQAQRDLQNRQK